MEEAARLIRVGRTKAYAMAREWRESGGRAGLPVVDFGHVLRVPRHALEQLIGAELTGPAPEIDGVEPAHSVADEPQPNVLTPAGTSAATPAALPARPVALTPSRSRRRRRRLVDPASQPTLPFAG